MSKEIYISSTPHETRLAIVENDDLTEIYYERENEYTLAGSIYNGKVTRVLPGMQSSFVDIGLERDAFLYITDFLEEAGDSADFDGGEGRRSEGGRGDGRRGEGRRSEALPAGEAEGAEGEAQEPRAAEDMREPGSGERSRDRGRRQRGGGRDDRSGRGSGGREMSGRGETADRPERSAYEVPPALTGEFAGETPRNFGASAAGNELVAGDVGGGDVGGGELDAGGLGEGSPAAEGSRRWRGRRGRRRGRGPNREGQPETMGTSGLAASDDEQVAGPDPSAGYDLTEESGEPSYDAPEMTGAVVEALDASAAPEAAVDVAAVPGGDAGEEDGGYFGERQRARLAGLEPRSGGAGTEGGRGGRRGSRDGERGGGRDGGRSRGYGREASAGEEYGQESAAPEPSAEPILLPGESLAKYRAGGATEQAPTQPSAAAATSAGSSTAEFRLPGTWDGGAVLPGETLRPRAAAGAETAGGSEPSRGGREDRGRGDRDRGGREERGGRDRGGRGGRDRAGRDDRGGREDRGGRDQAPRMTSGTGGERRGGRSDAGESPRREVGSRGRQESAPAAMPSASDARYPAEVEVTPISRRESHGGEAAPVKYGNDGPAVETPRAAVEQVQEMAPSVQEPLAAPPTHQAIDAETRQMDPATRHTTEPEAEYEPTEGAASYRVDPAPPREFRQPAEPANEAPVEVEPSAAHSITPAAGERLAPIQYGLREDAGEPVSAPASYEEVVATGHSAGAPADSSFYEREGDAAEPGSGLSFDAAAGHDVTAIGQDGEMLSAVPTPPPGAEIADPSAPIAHETAIVEHESDRFAAHEDAPGFAGLHEAVESRRGGATYAPDSRNDESTEEYGHESFAHEESDEPEDEEDFHTTTLHAAAIEEIDYDDEETVETASDLGGLIRDMTIDEMTRTSDGAMADDDDEFAFEEEDSVGDAAFETSPALSSAPSFAAMEDEGDGERAISAAEPLRDGVAAEDARGGQQRGGRRDGRRGGRDRDRGRGGERGSSDRGGDRGRGGERSSGDRGGMERSSSERGGDRSGGDRSGSGFRAGRREGHRSAQTTNLPAISDLLKPGQELLVQIAKEPIAKKGARITSHIALPGRFLVFMPTVNHTGVSRKIESDGERRRLKETLLSEKGDAAGGFIVRTAAAGASEEELRSDLRFLLNLWADIKQRSEGSKSPALIYHDLNLVERILRDQVTDNFSAIWVDNETDYERILRFLQRFQPSLIRRVKLYTKETPLFEQFGISEEINKALRSKVWLKSGGSIVINQTEALVAIDINTGKYVGKTARLEDTIVKTNLDAIPEIVRQIRLRDLGGIIIIDFIDMDERKNRARVMAALEDELKKDRAPSKVLQFNDFGLVAITRKRVKQSLERTLSTPCNTCTGTGMVKSPVTVCNDIYVEMRKMQKHLDRGDVMLRVNPEVVKQLKSPTARWLQEMEEMVGKTILVKSDPTLHPEQFDIH